MATWSRAMRISPLRSTLNRPDLSGKEASQSRIAGLSIRTPGQQQHVEAV